MDTRIKITIWILQTQDLLLWLQTLHRTRTSNVDLSKTASYWFKYHQSQEPQGGPTLLCWAGTQEPLVAEMALGDRFSVPYLVGVVVRVANHKVQPVWFLRAKGTNGCRRFGAFISAVSKQKAVSMCPGPCSRHPPHTWRQCPKLSLRKGAEGGEEKKEPPQVCWQAKWDVSMYSAACYEMTRSPRQLTVMCHDSHPTILPQLLWALSQKRASDLIRLASGKKEKWIPTTPKKYSLNGQPKSRQDRSCVLVSLCPKHWYFKEASFYIRVTLESYYAYFNKMKTFFPILLYE